MFSDYNRWRVLEIFFDNPLPKEGFRLREISREAGISPPSVSNYLKELIKERLVVREKTRSKGQPVYRARRESEKFRSLKALNTIRLLKNTPVKKAGGMALTEYVESECMPDAIVLFGSASRGEDIKESDIDIFVQAREKRLEKTTAFEQVLGRKINFFFEPTFEKLGKELKNNILNGINLQGYLKVF